MRILLFFLIPTLVYSQDVNEGKNLTKKQIRKNRPTFLNVNIGLGNTILRDFATSPLLYEGMTLKYAFSYIKTNKEKEVMVDISYNHGKLKSIVDQNITQNQIKMVTINYSKMYKLKRFSTNNLNIKLGGDINALGTLRLNKAFQNNAQGAELIINISGNIKLTKDISRKESKIKKLWFINFNLKPKDRKLSLKYNVGLINNYYRNGYIYTRGQSAIINGDRLLEGYKFVPFSGFRHALSINYVENLKNKNRINISYQWVALSTGKKNLDKFELANNFLTISLMFNTNNR